MILNVAAGGLVSNFRPVLAALGDRFGLQAAVIDPYFWSSCCRSCFKTAGRATGLTVQVLLVAS